MMNDVCWHCVIDAVPQTEGERSRRTAMCVCGCVSVKKKKKRSLWVVRSAADDNDVVTITSL